MLQRRFLNSLNGVLEGNVLTQTCQSYGSDTFMMFPLHELVHVRGLRGLMDIFPLLKLNEPTNTSVASIAAVSNGTLQEIAL